MIVPGIDTIPREELPGKRILVRIDAEDASTLRDSLPTLTLLSNSGASVIIATHMRSHNSPRRLDSTVEALSGLLGREVARIDDWRGETGLRAVTHLEAGEISILGNLALEPGEEAGDEALADALAALCDIYCNDAFALSHEVRASTVGLARKATQAVAGLAFEAEQRSLSHILDEAERPLFAILGGELCMDKLSLAGEIAKRADRMFAGGALCYPFLIARGLIPPTPLVPDEMVKMSDHMMARSGDEGRDLITPVDFTVTDRLTFERLSRGERFVLPPPIDNVREDGIRPDHVMCDIGTKTRWSWSDSLGPARTVFWHGPLGICELSPFSEGTQAVAAGVARRVSPEMQRSVVCGRSLVAEFRRMDIASERIGQLTPAGRAALHYFARRPLPAVDALNQAALQKRMIRVLIPLTGADSDSGAVRAVASMASPHAEIFLLHARPGLDQERYPDILAAMSEDERFRARLESERIFGRANSILARHGFSSADQVAAQGETAEIILRHASQICAGLIVLSAGGAGEMKVALRVMDRAPCPVLAARPGRAGGAERGLNDRNDPGRRHDDEAEVTA